MRESDMDDIEFSEPVEQCHCEVEGCDSLAQGYWLPDSDQDDDPDSYLCTEHAYSAGWCWGCGGFHGGIEWFDFQSRTGLCENCEPSFLYDCGDNRHEYYYDGD